MRGSIRKQVSLLLAMVFMIQGSIAYAFSDVVAEYSMRPPPIVQSEVIEEPLSGPLEISSEISPSNLLILSGYGDQLEFIQKDLLTVVQEESGAIHGKAEDFPELIEHYDRILQHIHDNPEQIQDRAYLEELLLRETLKTFLLVTGAFAGINESDQDYYLDRTVKYFGGVVVPKENAPEDAARTFPLLLESLEGTFFSEEISELFPYLTFMDRSWEPDFGLPTEDPTVPGTTPETSVPGNSGNLVSVGDYAGDGKGDPRKDLEQQPLVTKQPVRGWESLTEKDGEKFGTDNQDTIQKEVYRVYYSWKSSALASLEVDIVGTMVEFEKEKEISSALYRSISSPKGGILNYLEDGDKSMMSIDGKLIVSKSQVGGKSFEEVQDVYAGTGLVLDFSVLESASLEVENN